MVLVGRIVVNSESFAVAVATSFVVVAAVASVGVDVVAIVGVLAAKAAATSIAAVIVAV